VIPVVPLPRAPINLVADGSFEQQLGATVGLPWQGLADVEVGPAAPHGARHALLRGDSGWHPLQQWIAVKPFTHYVAAAAVQSSENLTDGYFSARSEGPDLALRNQVAFGATGTLAYRTLRFEFDTGAESLALVYVGFWAHAPGTWLRVDDVTVVEAPSAIVNGAFEGGASGWQIAGSAAIENLPHTGTAALVLRGTSGWVAANQWVPVAPNTRYRAGAWVRTNDTPIDGWFSVRGNATQSSDDVIHQVHYGTLSSGYEWLTFDFDSGPNTSVLLYVGFWGQGVASFVAIDDVSVTKVTPLVGNYGFLTDYGPMSEEEARARIDTMVAEFHVTDVQFYDWFASYEMPTAGAVWKDPYLHQRDISEQTIRWYIDQLHRNGARAWAYVQSIAAENDSLANDKTGIFKLIDGAGNWFRFGFPPDSHPTYFANAAWADHQVATWAPAIAGLGFDGVHWDSLGRIAGNYPSETAGFHAFLRRAAPQLAKHRLMQTMNFVDLNWWDESLLDVVAFLYAEVWSGGSQQGLHAAMGSAAIQARGGVMAFYPLVDDAGQRTNSLALQQAAMIARWNDAPDHHLRYLVVGDGARRLVSEYFPDAVPLTPDEVDALSK